MVSTELFDHINIVSPLFISLGILLSLFVKVDHRIIKIVQIRPSCHFNPLTVQSLHRRVNTTLNNNHFRFLIH